MMKKLLLLVFILPFSICGAQDSTWIRTHNISSLNDKRSVLANNSVIVDLENSSIIIGWNWQNTGNTGSIFGTYSFEGNLKMSSDFIKEPLVYGYLEDFVYFDSSSVLSIGSGVSQNSNAQVKRFNSFYLGDSTSHLFEIAPVDFKRILELDSGKYATIEADSNKSYLRIYQWPKNKLWEKSINEILHDVVGSNSGDFSFKDWRFFNNTIFLQFNEDSSNSSLFIQINSVNGQIAKSEFIPKKVDDFEVSSKGKITLSNISDQKHTLKVYDINNLLVFEKRIYSPFQSFGKIELVTDTSFLLHMNMFTNDTVLGSRRHNFEKVYEFNHTGNLKDSFELFNPNANIFSSIVYRFNNNDLLVLISEYFHSQQYGSTRFMRLNKYGTLDTIKFRGEAYANTSYTGLNSTRAFPKIKNEIFLFPNPASAQFTIQTNSNKQTQYSLYSLNGQLVNNGNFVSQTQIDVSEFTKGVYLLNLQSEEGVEVKKVILR